MAACSVQSDKEFWMASQKQITKHNQLTICIIIHVLIVLFIYFLPKWGPLSATEFTWGNFTHFNWCNSLSWGIFFDIQQLQLCFKAPGSMEYFFITLNSCHYISNSSTVKKKLNISNNPTTVIIFWFKCCKILIGGWSIWYHFPVHFKPVRKGRYHYLAFM